MDDKKEFQKPLNRKEKTIRLVIAFIMMAVTLALTANYEEAVKSAGVEYYTTGSQIFAYTFHFFPILVSSAICGGSMSIFLLIILALYNALVQPETTWMISIYMIAGMMSYYLGVIGFYTKKRGWIYSVLLTTLFLGPVWGGLLGMAAGLGFVEFMPGKFMMYFLNELPETILAFTVIHLILTRLPLKFRRLLFCGDFVDERGLNEFVQAQRSRVGAHVGLVVLAMSCCMGFFAVYAANKLIPSMFLAASNNEGIVALIEMNVDLGKILNTGALQHFLNDLVESMPSANYRLEPMTKEVLAFDVKLVLLMVTFIIPISVLTSFYAQIRLSLPIFRMKRGIDSLMKDEEKDAEESLERFREIDIHTGDEMEELFHAYDAAMTRVVDSVKVVQHAKELENDLEVAQAANEAKTNFLSNMSHEIRTPINAMLGFDVMILRESKDPNILQYAGNIQNAGKMLLGIINDILDFSRIEAGRMEIIPVEYSPETLLRETVEMAYTRANEKGLTVSTLFNPEIPRMLMGDDKRIKQCITNILTNAIKYTEEGGVKITSTFRKIDNDHVGLRISVIDTGIGIKKEDIEKLFSPFERIEEERNRTIEGAGLGLNIVKRLLELMGTRLDVESTYGEGSIFSFEVKQKVVSWEPMGVVVIGDMVPQAAAGASPADAGGPVAGAGTPPVGAGGPPMGAGGPPMGAGGPPMGAGGPLMGAGGPPIGPGGPPKRYHTTFQAPNAKILVVDDTVVNLKVVEGLLRQTLIQVDDATSGDEAIAKAKEKKYDLIFMDHRMPEKDGIETFHEIRDMEECASRNTPVIALTANVVSGAREMFLKEGFNGFLSKPVDPGDMEDIIVHFLPADMIVREDDEDFDRDAISRDMGGPEIGAAIRKLLAVKGIDQPEGSRNCGGPILHVEALRNFHASIDRRAEAIEKYEKEGDIRNYTIEVHGLKSSARVVGAVDLSNKAAHLEACGEENNIEEIRKLTADLLALFRQYKEWLKPVLDAPEEDMSKPLIPEEELAEAMSGMKEYVEAGLFDEADDIMKQLSEYRIPQEQRERLEKIRIRLAAVDRDGLLKLL